MRGARLTAIVSMSAAALLLLGVRAEAEESPRPPVQLRLDPCVDLSSLGVRRIVAMELDAELVDSSQPGDAPGELGESVFTASNGEAAREINDASITQANVTHVEVTCSLGTVVIEVDDPMTGTCLRRRISLNQVAESARVRTLAVAIVESVAASWVELELGVDQSPACIPRARPGPGADQLAARRYDQMSKRAWVAAVTFAATMAAQPDVVQAETSAPEGGACIPAEVRERVLSCPATAATVAQAPRRRARSTVATRAAREKAAPAPSKGPADPGVDGTGVRRPGAGLDSKRRERYEILEQEARLTERLRDSTNRSHPTYHDVVQRLSQIYEDLATAMRTKVRALDEPIHQARQGEKNRRLSQLLEQQRELERGEVRWRVEAIKGYRHLADEFPDNPHRDEVLFRLGTMLEELADGERLRRQVAGQEEPSEREEALRERARRAYQDLIRAHPASRFVPHAYLSFAEFYFREGEMESALRLYERAAQDQTSSVFGYAVYKSAWCRINLQQDREAVSDFVRVIEYATSSADVPNAGPLTRSARMELIGPYARAFGPERAWAFFGRVGGPLQTQMMEALAQHYFDQGQWPEAVAAYHALIANNEASHHLCLYQARVAEAARRGQSRQEQVLELRRAVDLMETFLERGGHPEEDVLTCRREVATLVIDVATSWHQETVGNDQSPGTGDADVMRMASEVYALALEAFEGLDELELEGWSAAERPTRYRLRYWAADLLWSRRDWQGCGPAFDAVVEMDPEGEFLQDAAYSAVLCYDNLFRAERGEVEAPSSDTNNEVADAESLAPRELTEGERAMEAAFRRYVCQVSEGEDLARVKLRRAMLFYDANRFEEAAVLLADAAFGSPEAELAPIAAQYYVDALHAIARRDESRDVACEEAIDVAARRALEDERLTGDATVREHFAQLRCGIQWSRGERSSREGDYDRCASLFLELYRDHSEACSTIGDHGLDEVLYNAAICLESDYRIGQAIQVRRRLIAEYGEDSPAASERGEPSPWAQRALHQIGGNYHAIAAYTKAAEYYEEYANRYPGEDEAAGALRNATVIRLGLGQHERALQNSRLFEKNYGRRQAADTSTVVGAVGSIYLHQKQWPEAERHYRNFLRRYGKRAPADELIAARVNLGYVLWQRSQGSNERARDNAGAVRELRKAVAVADRGRRDDETLRQRLERYRAMLASRDEENDGRAEINRRLARMVNAIAKARFYIAEERYEQFAAIELPAFRPSKRLAPAVRAFWTEEVGPEKARGWEQALRFMNGRERQRQLAQVQFEHWTKTELIPWVERRQAAQKRAETAFLDVVSEDVPEWEIAAASRVGEMHREMMQTFYDTPAPPLVREDEELLAIYEEALDRQAQPFREAAIGAFEHCLREATKNRWFNDWSRSCERRLHALSPRDYPMADEFRTTPTHTGQILAVPSLVSDLSLSE